MLNSIWLALISIGVGVASWSDARDLSANTYHNGQQISVTIEHPDRWNNPEQDSRTLPCTLIVAPADFNAAYGTSVKDTIRQKAEYLSGALHVFVEDRTPDVWKDLCKAQRNTAFLLARVAWRQEN